MVWGTGDTREITRTPKSYHDLTCPTLNQAPVPPSTHSTLTASLLYVQVSTWRLAANQAASVAEEAQGRAELLNTQLQEVRLRKRGRDADWEEGRYSQTVKWTVIHARDDRNACSQMILIYTVSRTPGWSTIS